jgi:antirestriction protein ArdC
MTYRQATERGGSVKKGSKGCPVVFWRWADRDDEEAEGTDGSACRRAPVLRYYTVFNLEQCEGITVPTETPRTFEPIAECERIVRRMPNAPRIDHQGAQAFYRPSTDTIVTPIPELFDSRELFYSVLFHELTHYAETRIMPS